MKHTYADSHPPLLSPRDIDFLLYEWLDVGALCDRPRYREHSIESFDSVLDLAVEIAIKRFAPPALGVSAEVLALLRGAGLPVTMAWLLVDTACHWMILTVDRHWRDALPDTDSAALVHRIGELMSASRVGRMCPVTYVLDDDIDPTNTADVLWALGTRIHPNLRQEHWPVPILPWYLCYTEQERHSAQASIVVHDGLLPAPADPRVRPATFDSLYPADIRKRVLAAEASSAV
jgi:4-hydroxy-3-polyprenylbenzoate decarboxylase